LLPDPTLLPNTVIEAAPVPAWFDATTLETEARSNDIPRVTLAVAASAVATAVSAAERPAVVLHCTADADAHALASLPLPTQRERALFCCPEENCDPSSVTDNPPVMGQFTFKLLLNDGSPYDKPAVRLPTRTAAETTATLQLPHPNPGLVFTALDDAHAVTSAALSPTRTRALVAIAPAYASDASNVTQTDPVAGVFTGDADVGAGLM
jgi:hypothetical protein